MFINSNKNYLFFLKNIHFPIFKTNYFFRNKALIIFKKILCFLTMKSCRNFRKLLETDCVPIIGAFNGLVARSVAEQGFYSQKDLIENKFKIFH